MTLHRLQRLQIGGHGLALTGAEVLRSAVEHAPFLQQLVVNFAISNAGVARLAPCLSHSGALSSLCLSAAAVGDAGAAALALPLAHNVALVELDLSRVRPPGLRNDALQARCSSAFFFFFLVLPLQDTVPASLVLSDYFAGCF